MAFCLSVALIGSLHKVTALPSLVRKAASPQIVVGALEAEGTREVLTCNDVFSKAWNIVSIYKRKKGDTIGEVADETLSKLQQKFELNSAGGEVLDNFNKVLNGLDLGDGLRNGQIWTVTHAEMFYQCALGVAGMLEANPSAVELRGLGHKELKLCGGDMVCAGRAHSNDGPVWDRTLWPVGPLPFDEKVVEILVGGSNDTLDVDENAVGQPPQLEETVFDDDSNSSDNSSDTENNSAIANRTLTNSSGGGNRASMNSSATTNRTSVNSTGNGTLTNSSSGSAGNSSLLAKISAVVVNGTSAESPEVDESRAFSQQALNETEATFHEIPYCFAKSLSKPAKDAFAAAIYHIQVQVPCVKFQPVQSFSDRDACIKNPSILVQSERGGCWSHVGQISGIAQAYTNRSQALNIDRGCATKGMVVHQLSHALGLIHEIYRPTRNEMINLQMENSFAEASDSFQIVKDVDMREDLGASEGRLDFLSVMMYGAFSFSKNGKMVAKPRDLRIIRFMGQRMGLSEVDAQALGNMYGCADQVSPLDPNAKFSTALQQAASANEDEFESGFEGSCRDRVDTTYFDYGENGNKRMSCEELRYACKHSIYGASIRKNCPQSCHECVPDMWPTQERSCALCETET